MGHFLELLLAHGRCGDSERGGRKTGGYVAESRRRGDAVCERRILWNEAGALGEGALSLCGRQYADL